MSDVLLCHDEGPVRVLTLNRPEKKNAFDLALADALWTALERASDDPAVRVVVVTGQGETWTSGADVSVFLAAGQGTGGDLRRLAFLHEPLRASKKPVLAAVPGMAVGMGVTLLPHFDLVYAAEEATFLVPFARLGLVVEFGGSFTLPRLLGHQRTRELLLRARPIDARTAELWGLVTRVLPRASLMGEVMAAAREIAELPPGAILDCRRLVQGGEERKLAEAIEEENRVLATRYGSEENVAAVMAFLSRRKPG